MSDNPLPRWAWGLSCRVRGALVMAWANGDLSKITKAMVRRKGKDWWLRQPHVGRQSVAELGWAVDWLTPRERAERRRMNSIPRPPQLPIFGSVRIQYGVPISAQEAGVKL